MIITIHNVGTKNVFSLFLYKMAYVSLYSTQGETDLFDFILKVCTTFWV